MRLSVRPAAASLSRLKHEPEDQQPQPEPPEADEERPHGRQQGSMSWTQAKPEEAKEAAHGSLSFPVVPTARVGTGTTRAMRTFPSALLQRITYQGMQDSVLERVTNWMGPRSACFSACLHPNVLPAPASASKTHRASSFRAFLHGFIHYQLQSHSRRALMCSYG